MQKNSDKVKEKSNCNDNNVLQDNALKKGNIHQVKNFRLLKKGAIILAFTFLFAGFGMIHGSSLRTERIGSILIGLGSLYFIILLVLDQMKKKKKVNNEK